MHIELGEDVVVLVVFAWGTGVKQLLATEYLSRGILLIAWHIRRRLTAPRWTAALARLIPAATTIISSLVFDQNRYMLLRSRYRRFSLLLALLVDLWGQKIEIADPLDTVLKLEFLRRAN